MKLTEELGPTSTKLFRALKREGVLESFVSQCKDINKLIRNQDGYETDIHWHDRVGGFLWGNSKEGYNFWNDLNSKIWREVYRD